MTKPNPRTANGHRRRQVRARVLREETICALCCQPVDKTLKTPHPGSPEVDEIIPVSHGGSPTDRRNCQLAHRWCNQQKSDNLTPASTTPPSTDHTTTTPRQWWTE